MSYLDQYSAPADPVIIPHAADPSSPPSIDESQLGSSAFPSSSGVPRLPQVKLRIKLGRETPQSAPQIMESSVSYQYSNNDNEDDSGEEESVPFSGVNANAVRSSINTEETNGSEAPADNESNVDDASTTEQTTPKKELRERKRVSDSGSKKSGKKGSAKRGRKPRGAAKKEEKEEKADEGEEGEEEEDNEEDEVYEVERILAHDWAADGEVIFKVKWLGYGPEFNTWEPETMLSSAKARLAEYKKSLPVETRAELEEGKEDKKKKKSGRGRPSNASKSAKRPRRDSPADLPSDESNADAKESEDDDYKVEKRDGPSASSSATRSRGRPAKSKGALKLFDAPKSTGPPRKKPFLESRQGWLNESGSDSDSDNDSKKEKRNKEARESPAPKTGGGRKRRGGSEETSMTNGRHSSRGAVSSAAASIEGIYRHSNGEVDVVIGEGRGEQRVVGLRDAFDLVGFGLVQFLADRFQFQA